LQHQLTGIRGTDGGCEVRHRDRCPSSCLCNWEHEWADVALGPGKRGMVTRPSSSFTATRPLGQATRRSRSICRTHSSSWFQLATFRLSSLRSRSPAKAAKTATRHPVGRRSFCRRPVHRSIVWARSRQSAILRCRQHDNRQVQRLGAEEHDRRDAVLRRVHSRRPSTNRRAQCGGCSHTRKHRPWQLHVRIEFSDEQRAAAFEKYLKSGSGRAFARRHF
jgi:hypothetical protein